MLISSAKRLKQIFKFIIIYEASTKKINTAEKRRNLEIGGIFSTLDFFLLNEVFCIEELFHGPKFLWKTSNTKNTRNDRSLVYLHWEVIKLMCKKCTSYDCFIVNNFGSYIKVFW